MPLYECNENQFVENIRRLLEAREKFLVNRKIVLHDDAKYGPATLPEEEFKRCAAGEHLAPEELRRRGIERYRAQMEKARVRRAQAQGIQTTPAVETPAGVATNPAQ